VLVGVQADLELKVRVLVCLNGQLTHTLGGVSPPPPGKALCYIQALLNHKSPDGRTNDVFQPHFFAKLVAECCYYLFKKVWPIDILCARPIWWLNNVGKWEFAGHKWKESRISESKNFGNGLKFGGCLGNSPKFGSCQCIRESLGGCQIPSLCVVFRPCWYALYVPANQLETTALRVAGRHFLPLRWEWSRFFFPSPIARCK
jgi:hypothetical protein